MIINSIASIIYILYKIILSKNDDMIILLDSNKDLLDKYNRTKRTSITVYILGVLLGLIILIIFDNDCIKPSSPKNIISDVDDIYVK